MNSCEMCGAEGNLKKVKVAGTLMNLCGKCSIHGVAEEEKNKRYSFYKKKKSLDLPEEVLVDDAVRIVQKALSAQNLTIHSLARAINLKESTLQKFFAGKISLDLKDAKKIQTFLKIKIVEEARIPDINEYLDEEEEEGANTLGDLLKKGLNKFK